MNYRSHQHLKLKDLSLHPKQCLHVISMLTNGQSYANIQHYIQRTLKTDILKSTISNLKHKVITARSLKIPLSYLLDERKPLKSTSKHGSNNDHITLLNCIDSMIRAYYGDIQSQTLTDKQRKAFIQLIKIKLHYGNQLKDEVLDTDTLRSVLEVDQRKLNLLTIVIVELTKKNAPLQNRIQHAMDQLDTDIRELYNHQSLELMRNYCQRHNIEWNGSMYDKNANTPNISL